MGYGAVLFDLDGTLIDTQKGIVRSFVHTFRTLGCEVEEQTIRRYLGPPLRESFAQHFSGEDVERAVQIYRDYYARHGLEGVAPFEGVPDMLKALRAAGYTVCVATGKARDVALQVLEHFSMTQYFAYVGGASADASLETKAAVIRSVLAQPALAGLRAVMVGDRDNDMQGARACGPGVYERHAPAHVGGYRLREQGKVGAAQDEGIHPRGAHLAKALLHCRGDLGVFRVRPTRLDQRHQQRAA